MRKFLSYTISSTVVGIPWVVAAQGRIPTYNPVPDFAGPQAFIDKMGIIANWLGGIILGIAVIMIIYAAFTFLTAGGSEEKLTTARNTLIYALVGVIVALLAFALPAVVRTFLV